EDGIRDFHVTGVQTCALPIFSRWRAVYPRIERFSRCERNRGSFAVLIPCIDLQDGQAVQLVRGRKRELAVADVFGLLHEFSKYRSEERRVGKSVDLGGGGSVR